MTDYPKLTDAEIAERVCRRLGWGKPGTGEDFVVWAIELLNLPDVCYDHFGWDFGEVNDGELMRICCFDWPAPIMMQKVKEWLVDRGYSLETVVSPVNTSVMINKLPFHAISHNDKEPRALYEAFLQVEEK